jgi:hypothetical protein
MDIPANFVPTSQLGRLGSSTRGIGVTDRIHVQFKQVYPSLQDFNKLG